VNYSFKFVVQPYLFKMQEVSTLLHPTSCVSQVRGHSSTGTQLAYGHYRKPVIIAYKVIILETVLTKKHPFASEGLYFNPLEPYE